MEVRYQAGNAHSRLSVDHIIPRAVVPELENVIANLELMPLRLNESMNAKIGDRQRRVGTFHHFPHAAASSFSTRLGVR